LIEKNDNDEKTQAVSAITAGAKVAHFEVIRKLGEGGMGEVYLAQDTKLQRRVALKFVPTENMSNPEFRTRFTREAQAVAALNHPNIVQIFEVGTHDGRPFFAMELVGGRTLREVIDEGALPYAKVVGFAKQVAAGLSAAHRAGVVHRDIKPHNIMVTDDGVVKILDFGLARREMDEEATQTASTVGTVAYMSPEQVTGDPVDLRTDLFSLGTTIYELATGRRPFDGKYPAETANNIVQNAPVSLEQYLTEVPFELWHLLSKCLEKDPALRYQHAEEVLADLSRLERELAGGGPGLPPTLSPAKPAGEPAERLGVASAVPPLPPLPSRSRLYIGALIAVLAVAASSFWPRPQTAALENVQISAGEAEELAREFLIGLDISLYGYSFYTEPSLNDYRQRTISDARLSLPQWQSQELWQPTFRYRTLAASADHEDRYYVLIDATGRIDSVYHIMRPDIVPEKIPSDSASALAKALAFEMFGADLQTLEELPVVNTDAIEGQQRQYVWRARDTIVGGFTPSASLTMNEAILVEAGSSLEMSPVMARRLADEKPMGEILAIVLILAALTLMVVVAIRRKWFHFPPLRFYVAIIVLVALGGMSSDGFYRLQYLEGGVGNVAVEIVSSVAFTAGVFGLVAFLLLGLAYGALRALRPGLISGYAEAMHLQFPKRVWLRSGAVGLIVGALTTLPALLNALVLWFDKVGVYPFYDSDLMNGFLRQTGGRASTVVAVLTILTASAAVILVVKDHLKLGKWTWLVVGLVIVAIAWGQRSGPPEVAGLMGLIADLQSVAILWCLFRFGLLPGFMATMTVIVLEETFPLMFMQNITYRITGAGMLLVWLGLLVYCLYMVTVRSKQLSVEPA